MRFPKKVNEKGEHGDSCLLSLFLKRIYFLLSTAACSIAKPAL